MYPITSIFRTESGFIPGYGLAPARPGRYEFPTALLLLSRNTLHSVSCVEVSENIPGVVISTRRGFYGVQEDMYQGAPVFSIDNIPLRLIEPARSSLTDAQVVDMSMRATVALCALPLQAVNHRIRDLVFMEFRVKPISGQEANAAYQYILDFSKLSTAHIYMWFYHFLVCMFRLNGLRINRSENFIRLQMVNVWWRDIVLMLLKHFAVDYTMRFFNATSEVRFSRREFRRMLSRMLTVGFPRLVEDFALVDAVTTKDTVILGDDGVVVLDESTDAPGKITSTKLRGKYVEYVGLHISFPEITEFVETNGLIL